MTTRCHRCGGPGVELFMSVACDQCDRGETADHRRRGFVVWRGRYWESHLVFQTWVDAGRHMAAIATACRPYWQIRSVVSPRPIYWFDDGRSDIVYAVEPYIILPKGAETWHTHYAYLEEEP